MQYIILSFLPELYIFFNSCCPSILEGTKKKRNHREENIVRMVEISPGQILTHQHPYQLIVLRLSETGERTPINELDNAYLSTCYVLGSWEQCGLRH